jgi:hypothetical protein
VKYVLYHRFAWSTWNFIKKKGAWNGIKPRFTPRLTPDGIWVSALRNPTTDYTKAVRTANRYRSRGIEVKGVQLTCLNGLGQKPRIGRVTIRLSNHRAFKGFVKPTYWVFVMKDDDYIFDFQVDWEQMDRLITEKENQKEKEKILISLIDLFALL